MNPRPTVKRTAVPAAFLAVLIAATLLLPLGVSAQGVRVAPRITAPIDNTARTVIPHSTHPLALSAFDVGALDGSTQLKRMILVLGASPEQDHDLITFLDSQQTKGSPDYHQWLTPEQFAERFSPAPQDIQQATMWLQSQGFAVESVARGGRSILFSGTSAQVETAFQTRMRRYQVNGVSHVANATDISIPSALAPVVRGVASLHNFFPRPSLKRGPMVQRVAQGTYEVLTPAANLQNQQGTLLHAIAAADFAKIYDVPNLLLSPAPATVLNGTGETIAIVAISDLNAQNNTQDVADFRTVNGLPPATASNPNLIVNGQDPGDVEGPDEEATIDTEWSGAVAPGATIDVVISSDTLVSSGVDLSSLFIVDQDLAPIMNTSFLGCEAALGSDNEFYDELWQQAAAQGTSVFAVAGDQGAAGCDPNEPVPPPGAVNGQAVSGLASTPFNTGVGGTEFNETGTGINPSPGTTDATFWNANAVGLESAFGYILEMVWNESCVACIDGEDSLGAGGGGVSAIYETPSYQTLNVTGLSTLNSFTLPAPNQAFHPRGVPDVSLSSAQHDGYIECFQGSCGMNPPEFFVSSGTSFASPSFAGIMALVDEKVGESQGLANYVLYPLAAGSASYNNGTCNSNSRTVPATPTNCLFNDITVGNNSVPGQTGFDAGPGYDLASGLGSVDAGNLVTAWAGAAANFKGTSTTITSPAAINITHGQNVTIDVSVAALGGVGTPTGNVGLITDQQIPGIPGVSTIEGLALSGGAASTGPIDFLPGGSYNLIATYPGDGTFGSSTSTKVPVNIAKEASSISLFTFQPPISNGEQASSSISINYGTPVGIEGLVTGAANGGQGDGFATGTLAFTDSIGGALGAPITLNSIGEALYSSCATPGNCFPVGTNTINASYNGTNDPSFNSGSTPAAGPAVTVTVAKGPTATAVVPSSMTVASGGNVTLTATVGTQSAGLAPTSNGTVQFLNNGTVIASVPVSLWQTPKTPTTKYPPWIPAGVLLLSLILLLALARPRKSRAYAYPALAALAVLATMLSSCGGSGSGGGGGGGGSVQIGAISVVTSTNGNANANTSASVVVQTTLTTTFPSGTVLVITANFTGDANYASTAIASRTPVNITVQ